VVLGVQTVHSDHLLDRPPLLDGGGFLLYNTRANNPVFMSENPEEIIVDIPAEVIEQVEKDTQQQIQMSEKEMRKIKRERVTQMNKILKNIKRRKKNIVNVIKQMDDK